MPFCTKCGASAPEGARFCAVCGEGLVQVTDAAQPPYAPPQQAAPQGAPGWSQAAPSQPAQSYATQKFSGITVRYRCPEGHVFDGAENDAVCRKCGAPLDKGGFIQMYRMGNYMGMAVGMGIYIDGVPFGHIGNKQSLRISVPYGSHTVHVTHTTTRKCNDPVFTVTPEAPYVWCKAHFSKAGFAITVEQADPADMPTK